uniref:Uncharacterized protein n=1 Tax=Cacopsylla melanoneura TaxID=428564 RepID=A0A8D8WK46_9HEMI
MVPSTSKAYVVNTIGTLQTESSDNDNDVTIICHDLIDLTDPEPQIDNTHHSFLTASMMQDTILFPEVVSNETLPSSPICPLDLSVAPRTPSNYEYLLLPSLFLLK